MELLGSRFIAHPANQRIKIRVTDVKHPLTPAMEDFEVEDEDEDEDEEPYYCEPLGEQLVLLEASYNEPSVGYVRADYGTDRESHPQMYIRN